VAGPASALPSVGKMGPDAKVVRAVCHSLCSLGQRGSGDAQDTIWSQQAPGQRVARHIILTDMRAMSAPTASPHPREPGACWDQIVILGVSAATLPEAAEAVADGADYLGVGPIFPHWAKRTPDPPQDLIC